MTHCSFWHICNICRALSARAVGRAWTGNSRTDSPSNCFYALLATRMFPIPWIETVFLSAFWQSHHCWSLKMLHHRSFYWSSVKSFLANCFDHWWPLSFALLQHSSMPADSQLGDHGDMWSHCFPEGIVNVASQNHLWCQCFIHGTGLQINANSSKLMQNWNCPIFLQVIFFLYLLPDRKYE